MRKDPSEDFGEPQGRETSKLAAFQAKLEEYREQSKRAIEEASARQLKNQQSLQASSAKMREEVERTQQLRRKIEEGFLEGFEAQNHILESLLG